MAENVGGIVWTASIETQQLVNGERQVNRSATRAGRNFDNLERKATGLNTTMSRLAKTIAGVFAVRQLQRFTMDTIRSIDEQGKFAAAVGVSFEALQKLQFAAEQNGATANEFNNSLRRLARRTEEAARGTGAAVNAFEALGLNAKELVNLSPDEIFLRVADSFGKLETSGQRVSTAFGLFDTEGAKLINTLNQGREGVEELGREAERTGRVLGQQAADDAAKFNDELNKLQGAAKGAAVTVGAELVPAMTEIISATTEWLSTGDNAANLINGIGIAAQATAVVLAGRFVGAMALSLQTTVQDTVATIANEKAKIAKAQAASTAAAAELALLKSVQAGLVAQLQSTKNEAMKAQIRARLAKNTAALVAANNALTASQARLNGVIGAGTVATRGFAAGLALLGGPVGVVVMAASAFALMAMNTGKANDAQKANQPTVANLAQSYEDLTAAQLKLLELDIEREMLDIKEATEGMTDAFGTLQGNLSGLNADELKDLGDYLDVDIDTSTQEREAATIARLVERYGELEEAQKRIAEIRAREANQVKTQNDQTEESAGVIGRLAQRNEELRAGLSGTNDELEVRRALLEAGVEAGTAEANVIEDIVRGNQALTKSIEDRDAAQKASEDAENRLNSLAEEIRLLEVKNALGNEEYERQAAIAALGPDASAEDAEKISNMITQMQALRNEAELVGESLQEAFRGVGLQALDDFSDGLARAAVEGSSVRDMIHGISKTILTELLSSVIRYWTGQAAAALAGQSAVTAQTAAAAGASAAAWTPAATLASIATLGGAAGIGTVALTGALASTQGMTAASGGLAGAFGGARQYGGDVAPNKAYRVNETEPEMFVSGGQQYLMPNMRGEVMNSDQVGGGDVKLSIQVNNNAPGVDVGVREQGSGNNRQFILDVVKADITSYGQSTVGALSTVTNIKRKTQ